MASSFEVTKASLTSKKEALNNDNEKFKQQIAQLESYANSLKSMWEGEAASKFQSNFKNDRAKMDKLYAAVKKYVQHVETVLKKYETAEKKNLNILK